ncbi:MATE family efflux transporter [Helicobacter sp. MIT 11-5569]|uniref:MATE family efflux transporter n=1 Tax=Helicobacter sp. MIT 11-5569 TaxID=1548151 RepID=UPI00051FDD0A|nr:MATE family efflux transporter [Helicobacter sp. MIT 11-5569]TLD83213.1 MATE family efflux transporter [Helicobacter sp. MIT 11-5569]
MAQGGQKSKEALKTLGIPKLFFSYFLPSLVAMLALSTYSTIDGIFVGKKLGENALAAIGIAWPIFPILIAFELLFSVGAAAMASYFLGRGKAFRARIVFSSVFYFALSTSIIGGIVLFIYSDSIALMLGSSETLLPLVRHYTEVIYLGAFIIVLHPMLDIFAINDKQPVLAMLAMVVGSLANIILNYIFLFILEFGIASSALATLLGHGIGMCILLQHFLRKKGDLYLIRTFDIYALLSATKNGIPQSSSEISVSLMMLIFNHTISSIAGDRGLAIYSVIMYIGIIPFTILLSMAQGVQPIASFNYGAKLMERVMGIFKFGLFFSFVGGIMLYGFFYLCSPYFVSWFLPNDIAMRDMNLLKDAQDSVRLYFLGYALLGVNIVSAIFFQSIQRTFSSFMITLAYTLLFALLFVSILPSFYGFRGVMLSYPLGILCATFVTLGTIFYERKNGILKILK